MEGSREAAKTRSLPSQETMDAVAVALGAPNAAEFLRFAPLSMKICYKLCCELYEENHNLRAFAASRESK